MLVIAAENVAPSLRGRLSVWLLEVRAGIYVGRVSAKTREMIWKSVKAGVARGNVIMIWRSSAPSGFEFRTAGSNRRKPIDFDGLTLVSMEPSEAVPF